MSFTIAQAAATTNIQIAAYIKLWSAFLNSSGFHRAIISLPQIKRNTPIATSAISANVVSFINNKILSRNASPDRDEVSVDNTPSPVERTMESFSSSEVNANH